MHGLFFVFTVLVTYRLEMYLKMPFSMFLSEHIEGVWGDAQRLFHDLEIKVSPCFFQHPHLRRLICMQSIARNLMTDIYWHRFSVQKEVC